MSDTVGKVGVGGMKAGALADMIRQFEQLGVGGGSVEGYVQNLRDRGHTLGAKEAKARATQTQKAAAADRFHFEGVGEGAKTTRIDLGKGQLKKGEIHVQPPGKRILSRAQKNGFTKLDNVARMELHHGRKTEVMTGGETKAFLDEKLAGAKNKTSALGKMKERWGVSKNADGDWTVDLKRESSGFSAINPGAAKGKGKAGKGNKEEANNDSIMEMLGGGWNVPMMGAGMFAGGGIGALFGMGVMGSALKSVSGGDAGKLTSMLSSVSGSSSSFTSGGMAGAGGLAAVVGGLGGFGQAKTGVMDIAGATAFGTGSVAADVMGMHGMAFSMRKIMRSYAEDFNDQSMLAQISNPNIPIEDLIFLFMAYMGDKYEKKLREKMEEAAMAERKERERQRNSDEGRLVGGIVGGAISLGSMTAMGPVGAMMGAGSGAGQMVGGAIESMYSRKQAIKDQFDGNLKSSTILMQEVQMLMHKWKQLNEMLSNLMKAMHDMAMTPIRNLR